MNFFNAIEAHVQRIARGLHVLCDDGRDLGCVEGARLGVVHLTRPVWKADLWQAKHT